MQNQKIAPPTLDGVDKNNPFLKEITIPEASTTIMKNNDLIQKSKDAQAKEEARQKELRIKLEAKQKDKKEEKRCFC